jgi:hypothetical protein
MQRSNLKPALSASLLVLVNVYLQFETGINNPKFGDAHDYLLSAQAIYQGEEYPRVLEGSPFFRAPGYPFLISLLWEVSSYNSIIALKLFNSFCLALVGIGIYILAKRNMSTNLSIAAAILATLNPFVFLQSLEVSTETVTTALFVYFVILLTSIEFKAKGIMLGVVNIGLIAIRPEFLFISTSAIVIYYLLVRFNPKKLLIQIFLVVLCISYWGHQNKTVTGEFMPLTNATTFQLWLGSTETIYKNYPLKFQDTTVFSENQRNKFITDVKIVREKYAFKESTIDLPRQSKAWFSEYKYNIEKDVVGYLRNVVVKGLVFWRPFLNPSSYGPNLVFVSFLILFPLMVLSSIGCVQALRRRVFKSEILIMGYCLIVLTAIHALQMPDFRYRVPIQIPAMSLLTAYFLSNLSRGNAQKENPFKTIS